MPHSADETDASSTDTGWTFTDDRDVTHTLDEAPDSIAAQSTIAGGLWEYGVEVDGVFGPLRRADGEPDPAIGLADPDDFTSLGEVDSEINMEALAALQPDIIVAPMWGPDTYWGIAADAVDELEQIAPIVGIRVDERPMDEPLARVAELAATFGDEAAGEADAARTEFDDASEALSDALVAKPGLTVLAASGTLEELYVAWPPGFPDLNYYASLGMQLVEPTEHPESGGFWQTLSWEQVDTYEADLILSDVRGATIEQQIAQMPPTGAGAARRAGRPDGGVALGDGARLRQLGRRARGADRGGRRRRRGRGVTRPPWRAAPASSPRARRRRRRAACGPPACPGPSRRGRTSHRS